MISSVSFGSMFNPERIRGFNPEHDIEGLKKEVERPKDFYNLPNESIGRSQVIINQKFPHKLELSNSDKTFLSELNSDVYGFHGNSDRFWVHSKKATKGNIANISMGDGKLTDKSRHEFIKDLINEKTQAFQIAGSDRLSGNKLITVVKNSETNTSTMYTCDSRQCYSINLDNNFDIEKLVSAITDHLTEIQGATVWKQ